MKPEYAPRFDIGYLREVKKDKSECYNSPLTNDEKKSLKSWKKY